MNVHGGLVWNGASHRHNLLMNVFTSTLGMYSQRKIIATIKMRNNVCSPLKKCFFSIAPHLVIALPTL